MTTPDQYREPPTEKHDAKEIVLFESRVGELMFEIASQLTSKVKSFQLMRDDDFVHRRDRKTNDIHLFLELKNGRFFHLRAYTRHMMDIEREPPKDKILLTGYTKPSISHTGGEHALRQGWYQWDARAIADELFSQNPELFT